MGQDPDEIRAGIAETRERMGETIDALGYKADVRSRAKENVTGKVDTVKEKLGLPAQRASEMTPDGDQVKQQARRAAGIAQENPLGLAVGAVAIGFLAGLMIPTSRVEDEKLGPVADQIKDQAKQTGQEALEHGRAIAQSASETARDEAQEHGQQLADSAKDHAGAVRP
jgi:gas vesicle protein